MNKRKKIRVINTLLAASGGVLLTSVWVYALVFDRVAAGLWVAATFVSIFWLVNLLFVCLVAGDWVQRLKDPSLTLPQMYWAGLSSTISLLFIPSQALEIYLIILIILVFGIFKARARDFYRYSGFLFVVICIANLYPSAQVETLRSNTDRVFSLVTMSACIAIIAFLCNSMARLKNRLHEKNEALNHALEAKNQFLANMSHELRTPMNGVVGMLQVIDRKNIDNGVRENVAVAKDSAALLLNLINEILDFSKLNADKVEIEIIGGSLKAILQNTSCIFREQAKMEGLQFSCILETDVPEMIETDLFRLRQVLNNLLGNAIKFTGDGMVRFSCAWDSSTSALTFKVEDSGIGIAPEKVEKLFDSFSQADRSTTRKYGGTGLGLSISKKICELLGGEISVDSELGKGSCFSFYIAAQNVGSVMLPKGELDLTFTMASEQSSQGDELGNEKGSRVEKPRLIIVDDNEINVEVCEMIVEDLGYKSKSFTSGKKALEFLFEYHDDVDALLLDCQMPEMDGYEVCARIREHEKEHSLRRLPVIALTANALSGDREKCISAGMDDYTTKPIDADALNEKIKSYIGEAI
ncbi:MAG: response regulator [Agarilytica sp.]